MDNITFIPFKVKLIFIISLGSQLISSEITHFTLGLWPEYDHPGVLGYVQVEVDSSALPFELRVTVPENTKIALSAEPKGNDVEMVPQEIVDINGVKMLNIYMNYPRYYGQFYFNPFTKDKGERHFTYLLSADKNLQNYQVSIQKQLSSSNFTTNLPNPDTWKDEYQINYFQKDFNILIAGDSHRIEIQYLNSTGMATVEKYNQIIELHSSQKDKDVVELKSKKQFLVEYDSLHYKILKTLIALGIMVGVVSRLSVGFKKGEVDVS
jgi:hypothetical protein